MTVRSLLQVFQQEDLNFLLTNRIPRRLVTRFIGWFSKLENPLIRDFSIGVWRLFSDLDLSEAKKTKFASMHDCFIRELKEGARPVDMDQSVLVSPCDAIVGACGAVAGTQLLQVKGFPYTLGDLLGERELVDTYRDGRYVTLRLTSTMYHRFHAPHDCRVEQVRYISGDTWNVNPIALKRIEKLFCKNERAIIRTRLAGSHPVTLVPVAAILVASIRLHCLERVQEKWEPVFRPDARQDNVERVQEKWEPVFRPDARQDNALLRDLAHDRPNVFACDASYRKGDEMGWFQHGSTIIVFAPDGFELCEGVREGAMIRMGEPLMRLPQVVSNRIRTGN